MDTRQPRQQGVSELRGGPECKAGGRHTKGWETRSGGSRLQAAGAAGGPRPPQMESHQCLETSLASSVEDGLEEDEMGSRGTN